MANRKLSLYYIETEFGCGIRTAYNINQAQESAVKANGSSFVKNVRLAAKSDIEWVRNMGGYVPEQGEIR